MDGAIDQDGILNDMNTKKRNATASTMQHTKNSKKFLTVFTAFFRVIL
jgi:hypothetical protein